MNIYVILGFPACDLLYQAVPAISDRAEKALAITCTLELFLQSAHAHFEASIIFGLSTDTANKFVFADHAIIMVQHLLDQCRLKTRQDNLYIIFDQGAITTAYAPTFGGRTAVIGRSGGAIPSVVLCIIGNRDNAIELIV